MTEISALTLDGELWRSAAAVCEPDVPDDAVSRILFAQTQCPQNVVFARSSAAWIWGAFNEIPRRWTITSDSRKRLPTMPNEHFSVCDLKLGESDVVPISSSLVTTPARTVVDIGRYENEMPEPTVIAVMRALLEMHDDARAETRRIIDEVSQSQHLPYKRKCLERLSRATSSHPSLTR